MNRIEHAVKKGGSLNVGKRKLRNGTNQMQALRDNAVNITTNMDKIVKVVEEFYRDICSSPDNQNGNGNRSGPKEFGIPPVTTEEAQKALEAMKMGKADVEDQVTADLLNDGGWKVVIQKMDTLYTQCLMTSRVPESWKNANIILIHKKGEVMNLKNYDRSACCPLPTGYFKM